MTISSLSSVISGVAPAFAATGASGGAKASVDAAADTSAVVSANSLRGDAAGIMAKYDLRRISFAGMNQLARELVAAGALPENKMLDFIPLRVSFRIGADGTITHAPDAPTDMIQRQQELIASQKQAGLAQRFVDYSTSVLNMFQNFQALREPVAA